VKSELSFFPFVTTFKTPQHLRNVPTHNSIATTYTVPSVKRPH